MRSSFTRPNDRHAWSLYIDKKPEGNEKDIFYKKLNFEKDSDYGCRHFKLSPEWESYFTAQTLKDPTDIHKEESLNDEERALLEEVYQLLQ